MRLYIGTVPVCFRASLFDDLEDMEEEETPAATKQEEELADIIDPVCPLSSPVTKETLAAQEMK